MRKELANRNNCRSRFKATFVRYGTKTAYKGAPIITLLFSDVKDIQDKIVCDHIWFTTTNGFEQYEFNEGDIVSFDARVKSYLKGYRGYRQDEDLPPPSRDYRLSHPNKISKLNAAPAPEIQTQLF